MLALLAQAFADMEGRIDPPSSLHRMTAQTLREKASREMLATAHCGTTIIACGFGAVEGTDLHLSKLAVAPAWQRRGILRRLVLLFEDEARRIGLLALTLQTRIELTGNHAAFGALGFRKVAETAHPGYERPTSLTFRKEL